MLNFEMKKGRRFRCTSDMRDVVNPPEGVPPLSQPNIDFSNGLPLIDASNLQGSKSVVWDLESCTYINGDICAKRLPTRPSIKKVWNDLLVILA
jgi:hypothetical protein